jgi:hypothetical protein
MLKIIKAKCTTSSTEHEFGYVRVTSPRYYKDSNPLPVVNNTPLRKGDPVAVILDEASGAMSGIILGRLRDGIYKAKSKQPKGSDIIFESGDFVAEMTDDVLTFNRGDEGMVYFTKLMEALRAIEADLIPALGGKTLSTLLNNPEWVWSLEDHKILH